VTGRRSDGWRVARCTASATGLLDPWPPAGDDDTAVVRAGRVSGRAALVLGSTQDDAPIDVARAAVVGVDIARRTTGGGAVLVAPQAQVWLDVWLPRDDRLWDDDIITAAAWLGDAWVAALESLGAGSLVVHRGSSTGATMSDVVCFAGLGPGEVYIEDGPSHRTKVMGLAQRRTRRGARFHTTAPLAWDPGPLLDLLGVGRPDEQVASLWDVAVGQRALLRSLAGVSDVELIGVVEDAVIAALP
jgi:lipoate-protein ligase A